MKFRTSYPKLRFTNLRIPMTDLAGLTANPLLVVPPPGANKAIVLLGGVASVRLHADSNLEVGTYQLRYADDGTDDLFGTDLFDGATADTDEIHFIPAAEPSGSVLAVEDVEDLGLYLHEVTPSLIPGPVVTHALGAGGANYVIGNVLTVGDAEFTVDTVDGGGAILTYTLTDPGTTVEVGDDQAATGGAGTGAKFDITAIDASAQTAEINLKVYYDIFNIDT